MWATNNVLCVYIILFINPHNNQKSCLFSIINVNKIEKYIIIHFGIFNNLHVNKGILPTISDHKGNLMYKQEVGVLNHQEEAQHTPTTFSTLFRSVVHQRGRTYVQLLDYLCRHTCLSLGKSQYFTCCLYTRLAHLGIPIPVSWLSQERHEENESLPRCC